MSKPGITRTDTYTKDGKRIVSFCAWCDKERVARGEPSLMTEIDLNTEAPSHGICAGHRRAMLLAKGINPDRK